MVINETKNLVKNISWLGTRINFSECLINQNSLNICVVLKILSRQSWHVSRWWYGLSIKTTNLIPRILKYENVISPISANISITSPCRIGMHVNWHSFPIKNFRCFWGSGCISTEQNKLQIYEYHINRFKKIKNIVYGSILWGTDNSNIQN